MVAEALAVPRARRCTVGSALVDRLRAKEGGRCCTSCAIAGRRLARVVAHPRRPALRHERCCRWPPVASCWSGRAMEALVDVARAALRCAALSAMVRALPPRFRGGGAAVAGRRSGEFPEMS
ncbi:hypothetical protein F511_47457 [Dorcoceras hygrometricum]|uniref:Uncharacterized protein n=1 Tax=Dorcoceras hygrometricum TaxID=472368 RepID=A0A2Z6ZXA6_9LAMI|nr:hypothetical protein F511_47457 [Dorcoceras hygrometricum]